MFDIGAHTAELMRRNPERMDNCRFPGIISSATITLTQSLNFS